MLVGAFLSLAAAQDLSGTLYGLYGEGLGISINVEIPNYGVHGVVKLTTVRISPEQARDQALAVFTALASTRAGVVSVSVHGSTGFGEPEYVLVFQKLADGTIGVYLNGEPF